MTMNVTNGPDTPVQKGLQGSLAIMIFLGVSLKISASIKQPFFNHLAATTVTGFSETLSLAKNSLSLARKSLSLGKSD